MNLYESYQETTEDALEGMRRVREVLSGPDRWHKGSVTNEDRTKYCIIGAMSVALLHWRVVDVVGNAIRNCINPDEERVAISEFNDAPSTTWQDVDQVLDCALQKLENA